MQFNQINERITQIINKQNEKNENHEEIFDQINSRIGNLEAQVDSFNGFKKQH